jgi:hypothetical protein
VTTQKKKPKPVEIDTFTVYKLDWQDRSLRDVIEPGPPVEIPLHGKHGEGKVAIVDAVVADRVRERRWRFNGRYVVSGERGLRLHHAVLALFGMYTSAETDHVNRDTLDNRISNLRAASTALNTGNRRTWGLSLYIGVCRYQTGGWSARVMVDGVQKHLGVFDREQDAALAYNRAVRTLLPDRVQEFCQLNAVPDNGRALVRRPASQQASKTQCPAGHPYDEKNTGIYRGPSGHYRYCRACHRDRARRRRALARRERP